MSFPVSTKATPDRDTSLDYAISEPEVAVIIPCYNEELNIEKVVRDFQASLPDASIYVFDNNSDDRTAEIALQSGAIVRMVYNKGKGNVIRRMFADVDADVYVMVDGDDTYDATSAPIMVEKLISEQLDMVVGVRIAEEKLAYRSGHRFGNRMLTGFANMIFGRSFNDMLSGYRVFSKRFVKSFPAFATGFETETEITVHALELKMPVAEVDTKYGARAENSESKLRTYRDGFRILKMILTLFKTERPFAFFGIIALIFALLSVGIFIPVLVTYIRTGLVPRLPTATLSMGLMLVAIINLFIGIILDAVTRSRREMKKLSYLSVPHFSVRKRL